MKKTQIFAGLTFLLFATTASSQTAEIRLIPPEPATKASTPAAGTTTTTVVTTTTTTSQIPNVVPTLSSISEAPSPIIFPTAATWVDDGSMDTRSQVERAKLAIRTGMANDPWLVNSVGKISVSADGESLTLNGMVNHSQERDAIERIARESAGQLRLINSIRVR